MMEREILEILADPDDDGSRLNEIVDQFRNGRDVTEVIELLDSSNAELVSIGAWILGELPLDLYRSDAILSRLHGLTDHDEASVRFSAFGALFPALDPSQAATKMLMQKLLRDPNDGVRRQAEAAAARFSGTC